MRNDLKIGIILGIVVVAAVIFLVLISGDSSRIPSDRTDVVVEPEKALVEEPPGFVMPSEKPEPTVIVQPHTDTSQQRDVLAPDPCVVLPVTVVIPPAEPEVEPEDLKTMYHTVVKGDSLFRISELFYGQGRHWKVIYNANRAVIKNPDILPPGLKLRIPSPDEVADKY
ncbi:MAG: LysM peptidoglycan-binding domain-containing protein [Sedimentisphaerales bacterium]|nr:LysM peptidoglycan-binding domain-containing protein [Sedimentisphaerales bacterium]